MMCCMMIIFSYLKANVQQKALTFDTSINPLTDNISAKRKCQAIEGDGACVAQEAQSLLLLTS